MPFLRFRNLQTGWVAIGLSDEIGIDQKVKTVSFVTKSWFDHGSIASRWVFCALSEPSVRFRINEL